MSETEDQSVKQEETLSAASMGVSPGSRSDSEDGLLGRIEVIEAQPLEQRAAGFEQLHDELLSELQRGDQGAD